MKLQWSRVQNPSASWCRGAGGGEREKEVQKVRCENCSSGRQTSERVAERKCRQSAGRQAAEAGPAKRGGRDPSGSRVKRGRQAAEKRRQHPGDPRSRCRVSEAGSERK